MSLLAMVTWKRSLYSVLMMAVASKSLPARSLKWSYTGFFSGGTGGGSPWISAVTGAVSGNGKPSRTTGGCG